MSVTQFDLILFGVPALISVGVALFAWQHRSSPGGKPLVIHGLGSAVWILSYGIGTRINSQLIAPRMLGVSWLAAVVVAFSGMYVAAEYTERTWLKRPIALGSVGGYLCLEALLIGLNPGGLFYTRAPMVVQNGTPVYEFGAWWAVHLFVVFVAATAMLGMFLDAYVTQSGAYRQQARAILGGVAVIYLAAIIEVAGLEPYPDLLYNATMAGSTVLSVTFLWALFYVDFLELIPTARRVLLEDIDDAAVVLDQQDRLVYANRVAHDLFGTDLEYVGMPADEFVSSTGDQDLSQLTEMDNGKIEIKIMPNSEKRHFSVTASTVGDDERRRAFVLHEITAEKEYRQQIEEQRDNLDILNQVLRHDIRNDLQLILAYTKMVADIIDDEEAETHLQTVHENAEHAVDLTKVAREMAAVMLSAEQELEPISISSVVQSEIEQVREAYPDANIISAAEVQQVSVRANEMLGSVFRNLLKNAMQHNDKPVPTVAVSSKTENGNIRIRVADNGPGISDALREEIFGKGEKGLDSEGTGIGLYLVRSLVESYGGGVWIEDQEEDDIIDTKTPDDTPSEGVVFVVELPTVRRN